MGEVAKRNVFDDDDDKYRMKRRKPKMKIANKKNPINQNSFHGWINNREVIFSDPINSDIDDYISISINKGSLHDWINSRGVIFFDTINQNIDDYVPISINQISLHDWINSRGVTFSDSANQLELVNQENVAILDLQNDVEKSIMDHFRDTVSWYEDWEKKKQNSTIEIQIRYFMWK